MFAMDLDIRDQTQNLSSLYDRGGGGGRAGLVNCLVKPKSSKPNISAKYYVLKLILIVLLVNSVKTT